MTETGLALGVEKETGCSDCSGLVTGDEGRVAGVLCSALRGWQVRPLTQFFSVSFFMKNHWFAWGANQ